MKIIGGLSFDNDEWAFSFVSLTRRGLTPYTNIYGKTSRAYSSLEDFITENIDDINDRVNYIENKHSFKTERIFFELPKRYARKKETENIIPLNARSGEKKITYRDINFAKKQAENIALDLDDICLHHIILGYKIREQDFNSAPLGLWARKISLRSFIVYIPSSLYDVFRETFSNANRKLSGFVYETLANYSVVHSKVADGKSFIINIKKSGTIISCFSGSRIIFEKTYGFGSNAVISYVAEKLSLSDEIASDIVFKYSSFRDVLSSKEISVKDKDTYINVSVSTLNNFVKEALRSRIYTVISDVDKENQNKDYTVSIIGRIVQRDGFRGFVKAAFNINIKQPLYDRLPPGAFGCARYGVIRLLESEGENSLWRRAVKFYRGYF